MSRQCCTGGRVPRRLARQLSLASVLPWAVLVLLPKCPLCLAAWLTAMTGVGFSAAGAVWVRPIVVMFWVAVALAAAAVTERGGAGTQPAVDRVEKPGRPMGGWTR